MLRDVEGVSESDAVWLEKHLGECGECAGFAESLQMTAQMLRLTPISTSPALVSVTQSRVRERAEELREREARVFLIGISFCLGLVWSAGSALAGWKLSSWLAQSIHVPAWAVAAGLVVFWLLPAIAMGLIFLHDPRPFLPQGRATWETTQGEGEWQ
jgi:hypothetical protein